MPFGQNMAFVTLVYLIFPALSDCNPPSFPPFGRSNRLSTLFKLAVMQLTQNAVQLTHTQWSAAKTKCSAANTQCSAASTQCSAANTKCTAASTKCTAANTKCSAASTQCTARSAAIKHLLQLIHFCTFLMKLNSVHYQLHPLQCDEFSCGLYSLLIFVFCHKFVYIFTDQVI